MDDSPEAISQDIDLISRISAVPSLLKLICSNTGMNFAAVARVSDTSWTACAVEDHIGFGLMPGGQLELQTTLCFESRNLRTPIYFDHASRDPIYANHHTPRIYNIESYISVPIVRPDGRYFGNLCAIDPRPMSVSEPRTVAMFESFADLIGCQLEIEEHQRETERALLDERATAEMREQFIAVLGHDLRNPLSALSTLGELFARRIAEPEIARAGEQIRTTTRRMAGLIDDVLDFARGRTGGGLEIHKTEVSALAASLGEVVLELRSTNPDRKLIENIHIDGPVWCDCARIQQLLSNLLANALSHGAHETPVVVEAWTKQGWLVLSVVNGGAPISPENMVRIFEPYWRPATTQVREGLGLGLHICSLIVKAHGGTLQVSSTAELGTQFVARIPAVPGIAAIA